MDTMDSNNSNSRDDVKDEKVTIVGRKKSFDDNDASVSSNDGDDEHADVTSLTETTSNQFPLTTIEGQMAQNAEHTHATAILAAKREYNRQNAARARKRAKTLLHTYQEQIQVLTTQLAQLRDQNRHLLATLKSLREENISIHQSQQVTDTVTHAQIADQSGQLPAAAYAAGTGVPPPSIMAGNPIDTNTATVSTSTPLPAVINQTLQNLLAIIYLTGASIQQSSSLTQQQQHPTSSMTRQAQITPEQQQMQWLGFQQYMWLHNLLRQSLPGTPSSAYGNHQTQQMIPYNFDAAAYLSRILTPSVPMTLNFSNNPLRSGGPDTSCMPMTATTSSTQSVKVGDKNVSDTLPVDTKRIDDEVNHRDE